MSRVWVLQLILREAVSLQMVECGLQISNGDPDSRAEPSRSLRSFDETAFLFLLTVSLSAAETTDDRSIVLTSSIVLGMQPSRARTPTSFYTVQAKAPSGASGLVVEAGPGRPLGEIESLSLALDAMKASDELVQQLHLLLFGSLGKRPQRKKHIKSPSAHAVPVHLDLSPQDVLRLPLGQGRRRQADQAQGEAELLDRGGAAQGSCDARLTRLRSQGGAD